MDEQDILMDMPLLIDDDGWSREMLSSGDGSGWEIWTVVYIGDVDAGMFRTRVFDNDDNEVDSFDTCDVDAALAMHERLVAEIMPGEDIDGYCTRLSSAAFYAKATDQPWRPAFALVGYSKPWE